MIPHLRFVFAIFKCVTCNPYFSFTHSWICSYVAPLLKPGHVYVFKREFNSDILTRYVSLGKFDNRFIVLRILSRKS